MSSEERQDRGFDYDYEWRLWIESERPRGFDQFRELLSDLLSPVKLVGDAFAVGEIDGIVLESFEPPPQFEQVPALEPDFLIRIRGPGSLIWEPLFRPFVLSLALGITGKISARYMVVNDQARFVLFSGINSPQIINARYEGWLDGELSQFRSDRALAVETD